jgi:predicted nucleic acid-binding protein
LVLRQARADGAKFERAFARKPAAESTFVVSAQVLATALAVLRREHEVHSRDRLAIAHAATRHDAVGRCDFVRGGLSGLGAGLAVVYTQEL